MPADFQNRLLLCYFPSFFLCLFLPSTPDVLGKLVNNNDDIKLRLFMEHWLCAKHITKIFRYNILFNPYKCTVSMIPI